MRKLSFDIAGYGKPPKHSQFQSGQSGNPRGKKVGTRGIKSDLEAELSSKLTIQINGKPVSATTQQLMLKTLAARAASGDLKAASLLIPLIVQVFGYEDRGGDRRKLSVQDQVLLDELLGDDADSPGHIGSDEAQFDQNPDEIVASGSNEENGDGDD